MRLPWGWRLTSSLLPVLIHLMSDSRFLRARKFDLPKAKLMWSDFIKWRNEFNVDELYQSFEYPELPQVNKYYPKFYHKTDKVRLYSCGKEVHSEGAR